MQQDTLLSGYRVLDLAEGGYLMAGKQLADLVPMSSRSSLPGAVPAERLALSIKTSHTLRKASTGLLTISINGV